MDWIWQCERDKRSLYDAAVWFGRTHWEYIREIENWQPAGNTARFLVTNGSRSYRVEPDIDRDGMPVYRVYVV